MEQLDLKAIRAEYHDVAQALISSKMRGADSHRMAVDMWVKCFEPLLSLCERLSAPVNSIELEHFWDTGENIQEALQAFLDKRMKDTK